MYLPAAELQQYRGFWVCPYCLMEFRDEERRMEKPPPTYKAEKYPVRPISYGEVCERCGKEVEIFYIWNGRRLCKSCLEEEQKKWGLVGGGPAAAPYRVSYGKKEGLLASLVNRVLERIGLRKRRPESEIVAAPRKEAEAGKKKSEIRNIVEFKRGRPLAEELEKEGEEAPPQAEGLMKERKAKKPKKKAGKKKKKK